MTATPQPDPPHKLRAPSAAGLGPLAPERSLPEAVTAPAPTPKREPEHIGPYRILERIGEGGMGVVYKAEQKQPVRRLVALKVIKLGMDTREVIARFEAERQALALLSHPNVAKVYEAGETEQGRPYFAMEFVAGIPLTRYCDESRLMVADRLELFIQVCHAVQHAHQKGIIHRDLKPSNILVTHFDGKPVPKVIDFGIAKAANQALTAHTLYTRTGSLIGTPEYMSPEQALTSGLDVDTRTDVYSLGVILYELLTSMLPFDPETLHRAGLEQMAQIIKNNEPPRLSARLSMLEQDSRAGPSDTMPRVSRDSGAATPTTLAQGQEQSIGHIRMVGWGPKWAWAGVESREKPNGPFDVHAPFVVNGAAGQAIEVALSARQTGKQSVALTYDLTARKDVPLTLLCATLGFGRSMGGKMIAEARGKEQTIPLPLSRGQLASVSHVRFKLADGANITGELSPAVNIGIDGDARITLAEGSFPAGHRSVTVTLGSSQEVSLARSPRCCFILAQPLEVTDSKCQLVANDTLVADLAHVLVCALMPEDAKQARVRRLRMLQCGTHPIALAMPPKGPFVCYTAELLGDTQMRVKGHPNRPMGGDGEWVGQ